MDFGDATKILLNRIQNFEPKRASRVLGAIIVAHSEQDVIRFTCASDRYLKHLISKSSEILANPLVSAPAPAPVTPPNADVSVNYSVSRPYLSSNSVQAHYWERSLALASEPQPILSSAYGNQVAEDIQNQLFMRFDDQLDPVNCGFPGDFCYGDAALGNPRSCQSLSFSDFPANAKTCHYFSKGFCRHGTECRYVHASDHRLPPVYNSYELGLDDHIISPVSKERLEMEICELLNSRRGYPVSIASLPSLYLERYGKPLQAGGYLTESRRQGRAGFNLTKLLTGLKRIRLIERAHGQHDVILNEDAPKYNLDNRTERNDPGQIVSGSRQVYLTFPPESTFTEEDVSDYFGSIFGDVEDVRIPGQQRRMFGFVTFACADSVKAALAKGNPHYVCGSRVLVKPYREKPKPVDRKYGEKNDHGMYYLGNNLETEHDSLSMPRCEAPRFRKQHLKDKEKELEMQRQFSQLQLGPRSIINSHFNGNGFGYGMEESQPLDVPSMNPNVDQYYMMNVFKDLAISEDRSNYLGTDYTDNGSQGFELPESPFASSTMGSGFSDFI